MDLKLARVELSQKPGTISVKKMLDQIKNDEQEIFYFDKSNSHKDIMAALQKFEDEGYNVYFREIRYGLSEEEYMYQAHVL
ncbi:MAG: hypothetical protein OIF32_03445 [Campylobacterales bacterium]|nr:hypothetical protein [Campylobacterales bacterium]